MGFPPTFAFHSQHHLVSNPIIYLPEKTVHVAITPDLLSRKQRLGIWSSFAPGVNSLNNKVSPVLNSRKENNGSWRWPQYSRYVSASELVITDINSWKASGNLINMFFLSLHNYDHIVKVVLYYLLLKIKYYRQHKLDQLRSTCRIYSKYRIPI